LRCLGGGGRLLVVGFTSGEIPTIAVNLALVKVPLTFFDVCKQLSLIINHSQGISIVGVRSGAELMLSPALAEETNSAIIKWAEQGLLRPYIQAEFPLRTYVSFDPFPLSSLSCPM